jgi:hypothetical protein
MELNFWLRWVVTSDREDKVMRAVHSTAHGEIDRDTARFAWL